MTELRKAAEMALEALDGGAFGGYRDMVVETLRQALAQPEQEPVAWADKVGAVIPHSHKLFQPDLLKDYTRPLYAAPVDAVNMSQERVDETAKGKHEPVRACVQGQCPCKSECDRAQCCLYTAPPKREWVGLTHEERFLNDCRSPEEIEYAEAIEAKLREKNGG